MSDKKLPIIRQKFMRGDTVVIDEPTNSWNGCFQNHGKTAVVVGSYSELFQAHTRPVDGAYVSDKYSLFFPDGNSSAWYNESVLKLVSERNINDIYERADSKGDKS